MLRQAGSGRFGQVVIANDTQTGEVVAIKKVRSFVSSSYRLRSLQESNKRQQANQLPLRAVCAVNRFIREESESFE
eukprot:scaffold482312_cov44-Prasinocladus_malaysianus.AAC.1